jgi:type IV secretory pathway TraG/TraD family ATPase VirD4
MANIQIYSDARIQQNIKSSSINPLQLKNINTNIYIKYGIGDINYLKQFLKVFYSQLMQKICNGQAGKQVIFMLDEAQNIGKIPSFEHYCAFCRSSNVSMIIGTQDLNTLYAVYGIHQAKSIINSLETKVIFPRLTDIDALSYIQNICGEIEIKVQEGEIEKKYKKHLFSVTDIRTLSDEEAILIIENMNPIKVRLTPYYQDKKLIKNMDGIKFGEVKWL